MFLILQMHLKKKKKKNPINSLEMYFKYICIGDKQ